MTVLGTLLVISGASIIILRAWPRSGLATADGPAPDAPDAPGATPTATSGLTPTAAVEAGDADRGARALRRLGPPDRLILWGTLLLVLAALTAGAISFELGAHAPAQ
jgi:hypothetical protein